MKKWFRKKGLLFITVLSIFLAIGAVAYADATQKKITAIMNGNISLSVNGETVDLTNGDITIDPITYEGTTYVPARYLANALGAEVGWDAHNQVVIVTSEGYVPDETIPEVKPIKAVVDKFVEPIKTYPSTVAAQTIYDENQDAGVSLIQLYANAVKSGDKSKINAWLKKTFPTFTGDNMSYGDMIKDATSMVDDTRAYYNNELKTLNSSVESVIAAASAKEFTNDSRPEDFTPTTKFVAYYVDVAGGNYDRMGVIIYYHLDTKTNKFVMTEVLFM